jgi:LmbE family N-acetylglucosaminyl deacetylase
MLMDKMLPDNPIHKKVFSPKIKWFLISITAIVLGCAGYLAFTLLIYPTALPQQVINLLPEISYPGEGQKILVFSPHPDDETIAVGGYISRAIQNGADVKIVLITNGNKHHNESTRYAEFRKATSIPGVPEANLVFLNFPDGTLKELPADTLRSQFKGQIESYNPDIVIYPFQRDFHPDHAASGKILNSIFAEGYSDKIVYQYLVHYEVYYPHPKKLAPQLYLLPPARLFRLGNNWQKVMLDDSTESLKQQAIYTYQSQIKDRILTELLLSNIRKNELLIKYR